MKFHWCRNFVYLFAITFLAACKNDDEKPNKNTATFLKEGSEYHYYYDDQFLNTDSVKIIIEEQIAPDTFLVRNYSEGVNVIPTQYWVLRNNNLYTSFRLRDPDAYQIECKFGQPTGTSWTVIKGKVPCTYTIEELNVPLKTGKGMVNDAIKLKVQIANYPPQYQYISPTVGLLGSGSFDDTNTVMRLVDYSLGTASTTSKKIPPITFGSFPFLQTGKFWQYSESSFAGDDILNVTIESKLPNQNIFKVLIAYESGEESYGFWYEDNGKLMAYDEGETPLNADILYIDGAEGIVGHGWGSLATHGTFFNYKINALNESIDTYWGSLLCTEITVTDGLFTSHSNYWNKNKGNVYVSGSVYRDVLDSNARTKRPGTFAPAIMF